MPLITQQFTSLPEYDRQVYDRLAEFDDSPPGTYKQSEIFKELAALVNKNNVTHQALKGRIYKLLYGENKTPRSITRASLSELLDSYESHLSRIAPIPFPDEELDDYTTRINYPDHIAAEVFEKFENDSTEEDF